VWEQAQQRFVEIFETTTMEDLAKQMVRNEKRAREEVRM
jgi:hypothetical protein